MKKKNLNPFAQDFLNTMGNPIFNFFVVDQNAQFFLLQQKYGPSHFNSGLQEVVKLKIRKYVFAYFQFDHFPKSKIYFENNFEIRRSIFLFCFLFFKSERFDQQQQSCKLDIPLYFQILRGGIQGFFNARSLTFSPNALYLPTKQL